MLFIDADACPVTRDALAVARARQKNLEGWAARRRRQHEGEKK